MATLAIAISGKLRLSRVNDEQAARLQRPEQVGVQPPTATSQRRAELRISQRTEHEEQHDRPDGIGGQAKTAYRMKSCVFARQ
jgi:hypothetical protein